LAVANYHDTHGHYPPPYVADADGRPMHSWRVLILPYIEGLNLYEQYDFDEPWDGPHNRTLAGQMPRGYAFHGTHKPGLTTTNYVAVVGPRTVWRPEKKLTFEDVTDGASNTILIAENKGLGVHWMEPRDLNWDEMAFTLGKPNGISSWYKDPAVTTLDGAVVRLGPSVSPDTLRALLTADGGEKLQGEPGGWEVIPDGRMREPGGDR
jgi:hypothetical protein